MNTERVLERCRCGEVTWSGHQCAPRWEVWPVESSREFASVFYGIGAVDAAREWARAWDMQSRYEIAVGKPAVVYVAQVRSSRVRRVRVTGTLVPSYDATEIKEVAL